MISSDKKFSVLCKEKGIDNFSDLLTFVHKLPYGRNAERSDLSLVLQEEKGTCSSKHAFLKKVAEENEFTHVKLVLGFYKMNNQNTPGIGNGINKAGLTYIPEAHCYLSINGQRLDLTKEGADIRKIENDILEEQFIHAEDVIVKKVTLHKAFLKNWIQDQDLNFSFEQIWELREQCILNLTN